MKLNQRGQFTIEAILLMSAMTAIALFIGKEMRDRKMAATVVEGPWQPIRGMIEDGVWMNPKASKALHPSHKARHATTIGDEVPSS
ncbi:MAG: hypothetical protein AAB250_10310 [Bdellovibrionota bacterium]